jgi:hypothetical protein
LDNVPYLCALAAVCLCALIGWLARQQGQIAQLQLIHRQEEGRLGRLFLDDEMTRQRIVVKDIEFFTFGAHAYRFVNSCMSGVEARHFADLSYADLPGYERAYGNTFFFL